MNRGLFHFDSRIGRYRLYQITDVGDNIFYGTYKTEEDVIKVMVELEKCNWDRSKLLVIKKRLKIEDK